MNSDSKDRARDIGLWVVVASVASAMILAGCAFTSPVVATIGGSPITKEWLDSVSAAFEGDRSLQSLVEIAPPAVASTPQEAAAQPGLRGRELRVALLSRRLYLEIIGTMLGRMGLDPMAWREQAMKAIEAGLSGRNWASASQRRAVFDFVSKWLGDRQMLITAIMPSEPDDRALRTIFEKYPGFGAKLCFSVIRVFDPEDGQKVEERLKAGESFSQVAADLSVDLASKPRRGDVGCVMLLEAFQRLQDPVPFFVALSLRPGQARGPIEGFSEGLWYVRHNEQGSTGFDYDSAVPQLIEQYGQARQEFVSDRIAEVAASLDVRIACPEGRWNPEQGVIEECETAPSSPEQAGAPSPQPEEQQQGSPPRDQHPEPQSPR